jgi:hypothetical protein
MSVVLAGMNSVRLLSGYVVSAALLAASMLETSRPSLS